MTKRSGEEPRASAAASPAGQPASGLASSPEYVDASYLGWSMRIRRDTVTVYSRNGILHAIVNTVPQARAFIRGTRRSGVIGAENAALEEAESSASPAEPLSLRLVERKPVAGSAEPYPPRAPSRARSRRSITQQLGG